MVGAIGCRHTAGSQSAIGHRTVGNHRKHFGACHHSTCQALRTGANIVGRNQFRGTLCTAAQTTCHTLKSVPMLWRFVLVAPGFEVAVRHLEMGAHIFKLHVNHLTEFHHIDVDIGHHVAFAGEACVHFHRHIAQERTQPFIFSHAFHIAGSDIDLLVGTKGGEGAVHPTGDIVNHDIAHGEDGFARHEHKVVDAQFVVTIHLINRHRGGLLAHFSIHRHGKCAVVGGGK